MAAIDNDWLEPLSGEFKRGLLPQAVQNRKTGI